MPSNNKKRQNTAANVAAAKKKQIICAQTLSYEMHFTFKVNISWCTNIAFRTTCSPDKKYLIKSRTRDGDFDRLMVRFSASAFQVNSKYATVKLHIF